MLPLRATLQLLIQLLNIHFRHLRYFSSKKRFRDTPKFAILLCYIDAFNDKRHLKWYGLTSLCECMRGWSEPST